MKTKRVSSAVMELWLTSRAYRVRVLMDVWTILFISTWFMALCIKQLPNDFRLLFVIYLGITSWKLFFHANSFLSLYDRVCFCHLLLN